MYLAFDLIARTFTFVAWLYVFFRLLTRGEMVGDGGHHRVWITYGEHPWKFVLMTTAFLLTSPFVTLGFLNYVWLLLNSKSSRERSRAVLNVEQFVFSLIISIAVTAVRFISSGTAYYVGLAVMIGLAFLILFSRPWLLGARFGRMVEIFRNKGI